MTLPAIAIYHHSVESDNCVGRDIIGMYQLFLRMGLPTEIIAQTFSPDIVRSYKTRQIQLDRGLNDYDILLYHYRGDCQLGNKILRKFKGDIIFKLHNVNMPTPYEWYSYPKEKQARLDLEFIRQLIRDDIKCTWLANSSANQALLANFGVSKSFRVPPFNKLSPRIKSNAQQAVCKILCVADFEPLKGHKTILRVLRAYLNHFSTNIELQFVSANALEIPAYINELMILINELKLENHVRLFYEVTETAIANFFQQADIYICLSENESYCETLLEAQALGVPIVAGYTPAIAEMLGESPSLPLPRDEKAYEVYAKLINEIVTNPNFKRALTIAGFNNVINQFSNNRIETKLMEAIYSTMENYL